jgi:hypothetical protein
MWRMPAATASRMNETCSSLWDRRLVPSPIRGTSLSPRVSVVAIAHTLSSG